jgi:hypothetical protein
VTDLLALGRSQGIIRQTALATGYPTAEVSDATAQLMVAYRRGCHSMRYMTWNAIQESERLIDEILEPENARLLLVVIALGIAFGVGIGRLTA